MDLEDWEVLPEDGFLQIHDDGGGNKIFSRRYNNNNNNNPPNNSFNMNYFICPPKSNSSNKFVETTNQLVPLPLPLPVQFIAENNPKYFEETEEEEPDRVSQVFFKKMTETEFPSDMKLDSPKSNNKAILPQIDVGDIEGNSFLSSPRLSAHDDDGDQEDGVNLWNWGMTGIGAIFSIGVAAVVSTVCIIFAGNRQKHRRNQTLRFQIYTDDKRIKQMVHHANKLNEAISGVTISRAHITVGGCYNAI